MGRSRQKYGCTHQERYRRTHRHQHTRSTAEVFKCQQCRRFIGPLPSGGHHRNHCPFCLYSRHVDMQTGDRMSECGARMAPIGTFQRANGEHVLVHRCLGCDFERFNRIAADDNFELVESLPVLPARSSRAIKRERLETLLETWPGEHEPGLEHEME